MLSVDCNIMNVRCWSSSEIHREFLENLIVKTFGNQPSFAEVMTKSQGVVYLETMCSVNC